MCLVDLRRFFDLVLPPQPLNPWRTASSLGRRVQARFYLVPAEKYSSLPRRNCVALWPYWAVSLAVWVIDPSGTGRGRASALRRSLDLAAS